MEKLKIYDIWLAEIPTAKDSHIQHGRRPVLVVSNNLANAHSPVITIVPLSSRVKKGRLPTHVMLSDCGLPRASMALCEQVTAIDVSRLICRIGTMLPAKDQNAVRKALCTQLAIA